MTMKVDLKFPGKKGICLVLNEDDSNGHVDRVKKLKPSWNYSWNVCRISDQPEKMEFVPMVWGGAKSVSAMQKRLEEHVVPQIEAGTCKRLLCFNEPDKKEQSNMEFSQCLEFWPQLEKLGVPLISPSCANPLGCSEAEDSCQGVCGSWMKDFISEIDKHGYRCDYIGVHWYGGPSVKAFQKRMKEIYDAYGGRPLVISEFAVADWSAVKKTPKDNRHNPKQVLNFMKKVLPWMEEQDWIAAYAWFPFQHDCCEGTCSALFDADGKLTACGKYYKSVTTDNPQGNQNVDIE
jgi:hypothetical protein